MEEGGTWEGMMGGRRETRRGEAGKIINLLAQLVTEFLTKSWMVAYERNV